MRAIQMMIWVSLVLLCTRGISAGQVWQDNEGAYAITGNTDLCGSLQGSENTARCFLVLKWGEQIGILTCEDGPPFFCHDTSDVTDSNPGQLMDLFNFHFSTDIGRFDCEATSRSTTLFCKVEYNGSFKSFEMWPTNSE